MITNELNTQNYESNNNLRKNLRSAKQLNKSFRKCCPQFANEYKVNKQGSETYGPYGTEMLKN